jgi:hypothetical protein
LLRHDVPNGTINNPLPKILHTPLPLLYVWEERVLPIETPPCFDEVGIPLLITINHFTI